MEVGGVEGGHVLVDGGGLGEGRGTVKTKRREIRTNSGILNIT